MSSRTGSTIVAVAALILVEEYKLRLDDPVDALLPELADRRVLVDPRDPIDGEEQCRAASDHAARRSDVPARYRHRLRGAMAADGEFIPVHADLAWADGTPIPATVPRLPLAGRVLKGCRRDRAKTQTTATPRSLETA